MRNCPRKEKINTILAGEKEEEQPIAVNPMVLYTFSKQAKQLMHVAIVLNHIEVVAMVDTGASHLFVADRMV